MDFASPDWFTVENVAIFDEHTEDNDGPFANVDRAMLEEIATNSQRRIDDTGDYCPVVVGHTPSKSGGPQPPVVGYAKGFRVGQFGKVRPRASIFVDMVFPKKYQETLRQYPRRSVEVWPQDRIIDPIALLGAETPKRDLGLMTYSRPENQPQPYRYSMQEAGVYDQEMAQELINQFMQTPAMQWVTQQMERQQAEEAAAAAQVEAVAEPVVDPLADPEIAPQAEEELPMAQDPVTAPDDDEDFEMQKLRMSRDSYREQYARKSAEYETIKAERDELARKYQRAKRERTLTELELEGYRFSRPDLLKQTEAMDDRNFSEFIENVAKPNFKRGPVDRQLVTPPIGDGGEDWENKPMTEKEKDRALKYMKANENGSWEEAIRKVRGLPVTSDY